MNKPHKHRDAIIAWANGEEIQFKLGEAWADYVVQCGTPQFANSDWRVKPKVVKKEGWVNVYSEVDSYLLSGISRGIYSSKELADQEADSNRIACVRIEWEEEE